MDKENTQYSDLDSLVNHSLEKEFYNIILKELLPHFESCRELTFATEFSTVFDFIFNKVQMGINVSDDYPPKYAVLESIIYNKTSAENHHPTDIVLMPSDDKYAKMSYKNLFTLLVPDTTLNSFSDWQSNLKKQISLLLSHPELLSLDTKVTYEGSDYREQYIVPSNWKDSDTPARRFYEDTKDLVFEAFKNKCTEIIFNRSFNFEWDEFEIRSYEVPKHFGKVEFVLEKEKNFVIRQIEHNGEFELLAGYLSGSNITEIYAKKNEYKFKTVYRVKCAPSELAEKRKDFMAKVLNELSPWVPEKTNIFKLWK
jgi:hypothetical protein